jgi:hypothetical protein
LLGIVIQWLLDTFVEPFMKKLSKGRKKVLMRLCSMGLAGAFMIFIKKKFLTSIGVDCSPSFDHFISAVLVAVSAGGFNLLQKIKGLRQAIE